MSTPDSVPARLAELNKTLKHLTKLHEQAASCGTGMNSTLEESRTITAEIRRLSNLPLAASPVIEIRAPSAPCSPLPASPRP